MREGDQALALELVKKLVLAGDPDYTRATPPEDAAMEQAVREMETGDYVPDSAINWDGQAKGRGFAPWPGPLFGPFRIPFRGFTTVYNIFRGKLESLANTGIL